MLEYFCITSFYIYFIISWKLHAIISSFISCWSYQTIFSLWFARNKFAFKDHSKVSNWHRRILCQDLSCWWCFKVYGFEWIYVYSANIKEMVHSFSSWSLFSDNFLAPSGYYECSDVCLRCSVTCSAICQIQMEIIFRRLKKQKMTGVILFVPASGLKVKL